jgi:hypothetical protein
MADQASLDTTPFLEDIRITRRIGPSSLDGE